MFQQKRGTRFSEENLGRVLFSLSILFIFLLSLLLTSSPAIKYRSWDVDYTWSHWIGFLLWTACTFFAYKTANKNLRNWDKTLFFTIQLLCGWGLITIWRIYPFYGLKQTIWYLIASIVGIFIIRNPSILEQLRTRKYFWMTIGYILIILTFFLGTYPGGDGPRLWLGTRGLYFQPSEFLKIIFIIYLSSYFAEYPSGKFDINRTILPTLIFIISLLGLLIGQRDLGTALIFTALYILMLYFAFGKKRILLVGGLIAIIIALLGYFSIDLIRMRFHAWIVPWGDAQAGSYQIIQSIIAIASGGFLGTGVGLGFPGLVPLAHSDFIFSAIAEETGVLGSIGLISLLMVVLFRGIKIAATSTKRFHRFLSLGITSYIVVQSILIIGGNIRMLPITGVTLPFLSYGGSSLLTSYFAVSLLLIMSGQQSDKTQIQNPSTYKITAIIFSIGLFAIAIAIGWWGIIRSNDILERNDNPRNLISNLYVQRGTIFDRNEKIIASTGDDTGDFSRYYAYPQLSNTIGYIHQRYGLFGIEESYDDYLRGIKGYPSNKIWWNYLLYDQPPAGRPIRLSIDLEVQTAIDALMSDHHGGAVILNASNGEILALSTSPYFNANRLDESWDLWTNDVDAPLLNRASQGSYPLGGLISPLLLYDQDLNTAEESYIPTKTTGDNLSKICNTFPEDKNNFQSSISNACYSGLYNLIRFEKSPVLINSNPFSHIFEPPEIGLPANPKIDPMDGLSWLDLTTAGDNQLRSSPLQIAASFAPLSNGGFSIDPALVTSVQISTGQWVFFSPDNSKRIIAPQKAEEITQLLASNEFNGWEMSAITSDSGNAYSWFIGGTTVQNSKTPFVVAVIIETNDRREVQNIGRQILKTIL